MCGNTKTEAIAKTTAHEWGDRAKKDDNSHIRECKCGEIETKDHSFDAGIVTKEPTHLETGVKKFTCSDCGFVREDILDKTPEGSNAVLNENTVLKVEEVTDEISEDVKANIEVVFEDNNAKVLASYDISLLITA